jgi:hypothetical protein
VLEAAAALAEHVQEDVALEGKQTPETAGTLAIRQFEVDGATHVIADAGEYPAWDGAQAAQDLEKMVREQRAWSRADASTIASRGRLWRHKCGSGLKAQGSGKTIDHILEDLA